MLVNCKAIKLFSYLLYFFWLLHFNNLFAQTQQFNFINYNVKDGMSHGIVNAFCRDSEGFLWVATYNGLDRFDGTSFKIFHADYHSTNAIIDNYVHDVCEDNDGNIWCGCEKGVSCYNKSTGKFSNYRLTNPNGFTVNANHIYNILCDRHGTVWCASDAGIFEFNKQSGNFKGYYHSEKDSTSPSSDRVFKNSFIEDPQHDGIWMSGPEGINFLDIKTKKFFSHRNNPNHLPVFFNATIYPLAFDAHNNLWFAMPGKTFLYSYNSSAKKITTREIETGDKKFYSIATILFDSKDGIWFSTWNLKLFYKYSNSSFFKEIVSDNTNTNSISSTFVWDVIEDKDGTLWFGTLNGISKLQVSAQYFSLLKPNELLSKNQQFNYINAIYQSSDTLLWLGTNKGLYAYNPVKEQCKKFSKTVPGKSQYINYIIPVNGKFWLAGFNDVTVFNPYSKKFIDTNLLPVDWKIIPKEIGNIHACKNGDAWITADNNKLFHFKKSDEEWRCYKFDVNNAKSISTALTNAMYEQDDGTMWFGTVENGIAKFNEKKDSFDYYNNAYVGKAKVPVEYTLRICGGEKDELYLMLGRYGLMKFNYRDSTAVLYRQSDGLSTESNFDMLKDNTQNIWLAGYQDVSVLNIKKNIFKTFRIDYAYGNFDYGNIIIPFKNGDVGISIHDAIAVYKPGILDEEKILQPVLISGFSVFENSIPFNQKNSGIKLNYKQNFFSISFSDFSNTKNDLQYAYKLQGFDNDWVYCGKRQIASYTNVTGGNYTFLVKASAANGKWTVPTKIYISVTPPFWQTTWFKILLGAVAIFFVIVIFKIREGNYRAKQEQKLQVLKVRDRIARDLHDDIGASLSSIRMYSEAVREQVKSKLPQADIILERISENSREMVDNMSDIVWAINPKNDSLQFMEDRMHSFISAVCSSKNIVPHFNKIDFHDMKFSMDMRKNIFLVFKEAVNNAAKYSCCKNIYIDIDKHQQNFTLSITDDGKGFNVNNATTGNGLHNMLKRAQELNGNLDINSGSTGTTIKLTLFLNGNGQAIPANGE